MDGSALCVCGHRLDDHHIVYWSGGAVSADECEFYGFNETGGAMQDENGNWVEHCNRFRLAPDSPIGYGVSWKRT